MPYIHLHITQELSAEKREELQLAIGAIMPLIPEKNMNNTMIELTGGAALYMRGGPINGAFMELRVYKASPEDAKAAFFAALSALLEEKLGIAPKDVYGNITEMPHWCAGGKYS